MGLWDSGIMKLWDYGIMGLFRFKGIAEKKTFFIKSILNKGLLKKKGN